PLGYQWYFNSSAISTATDASLALPNVQTTNAGNYSLTVSNAVGSISTNLTLTVVSPVCVPPPANIVGWWRAEGNGLDHAGSNNATLSWVGFAAGKVGQAFSFDGASGYADVPAAPSLDLGSGPGFTIEAWINPTDVSTFYPLVEWD